MAIFSFFSFFPYLVIALAGLRKNVEDGLDPEFLLGWVIAHICVPGVFHFLQTIEIRDQPKLNPNSFTRLTQ